MFTNNSLINKELWNNGPAFGQFYNFTGGNEVQLPRELKTAGPYGSQRQFSPITTGSSVIGIKFDKGVMIAADTMVSYGNLARYRGAERVFKINKNTILGAGDDYADFQSLKRIIDQKVVDDLCYDDNVELNPKSWYNWVTRVLYNRRSRMEPLYVDVVVGGIENGVPFLGHVDLRGAAYEDKIVATGLGKHLALPLAREQLSDDRELTQHEASDVIRRCMEVMYYRDCRASSEYSVAVCTIDGDSVVQGPFKVMENWTLATMVQGF